MLDSVAIVLGALIVIALLLILEQYLVRKYALDDITYSREFLADSVFEGEEAQVLEKIENRKFLPARIMIECAVDESMQFARRDNLQISHGFYHRSLFFLTPFVRIKRKHKVKLLKRGCYYITEAALNACTLYGLILKTRIVRFNTRIVVYPKLIPLNEIRFPSRSWSGDMIVKRWIMDDPFLIAGARPYRAGDPLSRVAWKATARSGVLHSHNTEFTASPKVMICLCFDINDEMWDRVTEPERIERGISCAASLAAALIAKGVQTGLMCNGKTVDGENSSMYIYLEPAAGEAQSRTILEMLAQLVMIRTFSINALLKRYIDRKDEASSLLLITPHVSAKTANQLGNYSSDGGYADIIEI